MTKAQAEKHTARTGQPCAKQTRRCACGRTWTHYEPLTPGYRKAPKIESQCAECAPVRIDVVPRAEPQQIEATIEFRDVPPTCPMCAAADVPISDDELASAEAAGTICGQCAEVVAENRAALACS